MEHSSLVAQELRMTPQESGRKGGITTRDNHITLCPLCGSPIKSSFFSENGSKGGETTLKKHGRAFYSRIGASGGRGNKREGRGANEPAPLPGGIS